MNTGPTVLPVTPLEAVPSGKNYLTTGLLSIFLGIFGAHRFYLGKKGSAVAQFLTFGGFGLWTLIDVILILFSTVKDSEGRMVTKDATSFKILCGSAGAVFLVGVFASGGDLSTEEYQSPLRNYAGVYRGDVNNYTSTFTIKKDGTIRAEIGTGSGFVEKSGTYSLDGSILNVTWTSIEFKNLLGPTPDVSKTQSLEIEEIGGKKHLRVGGTLYPKSAYDN